MVVLIDLRYHHRVFGASANPPRFAGNFGAGALSMPGRSLMNTSARFVSEENLVIDFVLTVTREQCLL
jgi:hypothetical protein